MYYLRKLWCNYSENVFHTKQTFHFTSVPFKEPLFKLFTSLFQRQII